ncbi:MAG: efflux RND transporter periplasmic adaptor subunit [Cyanobacteria bacterium]|nr:efflux RND transporter periplasmic adaptor subunit [Cyanobacteria bacterium CG_2015-22_32_23]NCQ04176.1 efflux RND transporter periplasmic adaptor subunit [Cyanobacteria bacterium CG_2015-09_32_10]NCS85947.1 efflux RND transporter periplasmic adaptor subunit [Cyanobacteria bacterium CG_2015-02_32_10]
MLFINPLSKFTCLLVLLLPLTGCFMESKTEAQPEQLQKTLTPSIPAVDVVKVTTGFLTPSREYIGTSEPLKQVILRSQTEGQILNLTVDVGDRIKEGQMIMQLDDTLLKASLYKAQAELISLNSAVTEAEAEVISVQAQVKSAMVLLTQAEVDANRLEELYNDGAIAKRDVELAITEAQTAKQTVKSVESQVKVKQAAVETAKGRIKSQKAIIEEEKKRLTYTQIKAPSNGYVLEKLTEEGNLIQPGGEIIKIGDFSQIKIAVAVSELELENLKLGATVEVNLDAFPQQKFTGIINRISPAADSNSRQIPVEILLGNQDQKISSGLLARVKFNKENNPPILIPETALKIGKKNDDKLSNMVFILDDKNSDLKVITKQVTLGKNKNGKIEVLSGLNSQDRLIVKSSGNLKNGQTVKLSAISIQ